MTFNEILEKVSKYQHDEMASIALGKDVNNLLNALLFVVLLHKPTMQDNCDICSHVANKPIKWLKCQTIQKIVQELRLE